MKNLLLIIFFLLCGISTAQTINRVEIKGNIKVPADSDPEGISIFNKNSSFGSVSSEKGNFIIHVKEGDSLYFSAVQYDDLLVVIDEEMLETGSLNVEIKQGINELAEVIVRPHNLSGNLEGDLGNIEVVKLDLPIVSAFSVNDYEWEWRADKQTGVINAASGEGRMPRNGFNFVKVASLLLNYLIPEKSKKEKASQPGSQIGQIQIERQIRARFDNAFFADVLELNPEEIGNFITYAQAEGFNADLLNKEREIDLIQFLVEKREGFRR